MILKFKSCLNAAYKVILTQPVCVSYRYGKEFCLTCCLRKCVPQHTLLSYVYLYYLIKANDFILANTASPSRDS